jgi:hypothetical protein
MAHPTPYARRLRGGILVIGGTTAAGIFDNDPRTWRGPPYSTSRSHAT